MIPVVFAADRGRRAHAACRVCGARCSAHLLDVVLPGRTFELFECGCCGSLFYDGPDPALDEQVAGDDLWLDYVQAGAGISTMLAPLFAIDPLPRGSFLDVGCGFGFAVGFWASRGAAIGLEPSVYGELGREKLGIDVRPQSLDAFLRANPGVTFDVVFSSEVIEHTADPDAFAGALAAAVADDGMIVLTTPAVAAVHPDADPAGMIAALSPGYHRALISPEALNGFFVRRGFHCHTAPSGSQTLCWASRRPLPTIDLSRFRWPDYLDYLETLIGSADPHLATGALSRLFKDALNTGAPERAAVAYGLLRQAAMDHYGIDLERPEIGPLLASREPLSGLRRYPSWLGATLLFGALHVGHHRNDRRTKLRMLDAALAVLARRADVDHQFGQEAAHFLPFARRQYIIGLSEALTVSLAAAGQPAEDDLRHTIGALLPVATRFLEAK